MKSCYKQICSITWMQKSQKLNKRLSLIVLFEFCVVSNFVSYMLKMLSSLYWVFNLSPFCSWLTTHVSIHEDSPFLPQRLFTCSINHSVIFHLHDLCHSNNALLQAQTLQLKLNFHQKNTRKQTPLHPHKPKTTDSPLCKGPIL
jgi:hypothetical protein